MKYVLIVPSLIAIYFLTAAFVPRIRPRWGVSRSGGVTTLKPHTGALTCIGVFVFIGSMVLAAILNQPPLTWMEWVTIPGFILAAVGSILDWIREPIIRRRK
jgi:UDP-N-acetylmuramyl pentapeptide phosphotransferase/UDP-N-acetylglucosamine-1-phosphate transferase